MNPEILKCQEYLHPDKPVEVTSNDVKQYLKELGWEEGDKIPSGMPEYTTHVLKVLGKPVTVKSLDDMFKDETVIITLKSALNKTKLYENNEKQIEEKVKEKIPNPENLTDGTRDELMGVVRNLAKKEVEEEAAKMDVKDDSFEGLEEVGSDEEPSPIVNNTVETKEEEKEAPLPPEHICPRCGFDLKNEYIPFPASDEDKVQYAYSILGGTPFKKTYKVAEGLLEITYKSPTTYVNRMIEDQIKYDNNNRKSIDYDQAYMNSIRYGLAASLDKVKSNFGVDTNLPVPDLLDEQFKTLGQTNLVKFTEFIEDKIIKSGTRELLFRTTYSDFIKLQVRLQYELRSENFIKAVLAKN